MLGFLRLSYKLDSKYALGKARTQGQLYLRNLTLTTNAVPHLITAPMLTITYITGKVQVNTLSTKYVFTKIKFDLIKAMYPCCYGHYHIIGPNPNPKKTYTNTKGFCPFGTSTIHA